jgi:hypothetical protein
MAATAVPRRTSQRAGTTPRVPHQRLLVSLLTTATDMHVGTCVVTVQKVNRGVFIGVGGSLAPPDAPEAAVVPVARKRTIAKRRKTGARLDEVTLPPAPPNAVPAAPARSPPPKTSDKPLPVAPAAATAHVPEPAPVPATTAAKGARRGRTASVGSLVRSLKQRVQGVVARVRGAGSARGRRAAPATAGQGAWRGQRS